MAAPRHRARSRAVVARISAGDRAHANEQLDRRHGNRAAGRQKGDARDARVPREAAWHRAHRDARSRRSRYARQRARSAALQAARGEHDRQSVVRLGVDAERRGSRDRMREGDRRAHAGAGAERARHLVRRDVPRRRTVT